LIELAEVIQQLRRELDEAIVMGKDEHLRFELGPIELEVMVGLESKGTGRAKVRFWVAELGADGEISRSSTQRIKLTLRPKMRGLGQSPWVSGGEAEAERLS
jgi:hypothetical protein